MTTPHWIEVSKTCFKLHGLVNRLEYQKGFSPELSLNDRHTHWVLEDIGRDGSKWKLFLSAFKLDVETFAKEFYIGKGQWKREEDSNPIQNTQELILLCK